MAYALKNARYSMIADQNLKKKADVQNWICILFSSP